MNWLNIKDKYPPLDTEVVVYYFFEVEDEYGSWVAELMHEKVIDRLKTSKDIYWIETPVK